MEFKFVTIGNEPFGKRESLRSRCESISKTVKSMSRRESIVFTKSDVMFMFKDTRLTNLLKQNKTNDLSC